MESSLIKKLDLFFDKFKKLTYKKSETLIRADDEPAGVFYLKKGYVRMYAFSDQGVELTLQIFEPGAYFPMTWAVKIPNRYYFECLTSVEVYRAPRDKVLAFLNKEPEILFDLTTRLLRGFNDLLIRIETLVFEDAEQRVIAALLYLSGHFGRPQPSQGKRAGKDIIIEHRFTHQDIANLAGIARETASLELADLEKRGLIAYKNHSILIKDPENWPG